MPLTRKNGSKYWYIQFELNGKRYGPKSTKTTDKKVAQRMEDEWKTKVHAVKILRDKEEVTLQEMWNMYLASPLAPVTLRNGATTIGIFKKHFKGTDKASTFDQRELEHFVSARRREGTAESTIANNLRIFASAWGRPSRNSYNVPNLDIPKTGKVNSRIETINDSDQEKVLALIQKRGEKGGGRGGHSQDLADVFTILCDTGARYNEIAKLEWDRINLKMKTIELWRSKTQSESYVFMTDRVHQILQRRAEGKRHEKWVFTNRAETNHRSTDTQWLNSIIRAAGVNKTTHKVRHFMATNMLKQGFTLHDVQRVLGHRDYKSTLKYAHLESHDVSAKLTKMLNEKHVERNRGKIRSVS